MHAVFFLFPLCELAKLTTSHVFQQPNAFLLSSFYLLRPVIVLAVGGYVTLLWLCTVHDSELSFQCAWI